MNLIQADHRSLINYFIRELIQNNGFNEIYCTNDDGVERKGRRSCCNTLLACLLTTSNLLAFKATLFGNRRQLIVKIKRFNSTVKNDIIISFSK